MCSALNSNGHLHALVQNTDANFHLTKSSRLESACNRLRRHLISHRVAARISGQSPQNACHLGWYAPSHHAVFRAVLIHFLISQRCAQPPHSTKSTQQLEPNEATKGTKCMRDGLGAQGRDRFGHTLPIWDPIWTLQR